MQFKLSAIASLLSVLAVAAIPAPADVGAAEASPVHTEVIQASPTTSVNGATETGVNVLGGPTAASYSHLNAYLELIYVHV